MGRPAGNHGLLHELAWYANNEHLDVWSPTTSHESRIRRLRAWALAGAKHKPRPDLPPLDQPAELAAWWDRVIGKRCPPRVIALARSGYVAPAPVAAERGALEAVAPAAITIDFAKLVAGTALDRLDGLRRAVAGAEQIYFEAQAAGRSDTDFRRKNYESLFDSLRKAEKDTEELREARGELIARDAIRIEVQRLHSAIASCFRSAVASLSCPIEEKERCLAEAFRPLRDAQFGLEKSDPINPQAAA